MCTPVDIALFSANVLATAVQVKEATEAKAEGKYKTNLLIKQAEQAKQDAIYERQEGIEDARRQRLKSILKMGEASSDIASGNIALTSQTALNILDDEKLNGELDALITLKDSERKADKYMQRSEDYYSDAALMSFNVKNNFTNSLFNTGAKFVKESAKPVNKYFESRKEKNARK